MRSVVAFVICLLLVACGGGATPLASSTSAPAGPGATPNPALLADLTASGVAADDAAFLASTSVEGASSGPGKAKIVEHLLSGDTTEFTVSIAAATGGTPGLVSATSSTTADRIEVHLEYLVSAEGMSDDVRQSLEGITAAARRVAALGDPGPVLTADVSVYQVLVDWATSKAESTARDSSIKAILESVTPGKAGLLMKLIKAGFTVEKGTKLSDKLDAQLAELDRLAECAMNPTNPLTKKQYAEDPGARDRILEQIQNARNELIANTIVMQLGVLNGYAASFGPKWLGFAIGPGTAWSKATLEDLNQQRLEEIKRAVTKCECQGGLSTGGGQSAGGGPGATDGGISGGSSGGGSGTAAGETCEFPFTIIGEVTHTITLNGVLVFTSRATGVTWQLDAAVSDEYASVYTLTGGQVEWRYDQDTPGGCGVRAEHGGGTELVVPDEPSNPGGDAGVGDPDENATFSIKWVHIDPDAKPSYSGGGITRLHDKVISTYCDDPPGELDPDWMFPGHLATWFALPSSPFPEIEGDQLNGEWSFSPGSNLTIVHKYSWEFAPA